MLQACHKQNVTDVCHFANLGQIPLEVQIDLASIIGLQPFDNR